MFGKSELGNSVGGTSTIPYNSPEQATEAGIASILQQLTSEVDSTAKLAYSVRGALGINVPESEGKEPMPPSSLRDALSALRRKLIRANQDFEAVINHINS